mmetsp:Transcript_520/g.580  ORF Transcript_520/g.580 Transcript_520/m.580 type:complete len:144 (+) Transcript_520:274-705(+)
MQLQKLFQENNYDGMQVDVWSVGVTLYTMLFGELPFDEENMNHMFKFIKDAKYYMHGTSSPEAKDIINKMLQPNPFKRITIPEILEHPWLQNSGKEISYNYKYFLKFMKNDNEVDQNIVDKLFQLDLGLDLKNRQKIEDAIRK